MTERKVLDNPLNAIRDTLNNDYLHRFFSRFKGLHFNLN